MNVWFQLTMQVLVLDWLNICLVDNNASFPMTTRAVNHLEDDVMLEVPSAHPRHHIVPPYFNSQS